jgi:hypothetical protein
MTCVCYDPLPFKLLEQFLNLATCSWVHSSMIVDCKIPLLQSRIPFMYFLFTRFRFKAVEGYTLLHLRSFSSSFIAVMRSEQATECGRRLGVDGDSVPQFVNVT